MLSPQDINNLEASRKISPAAVANAANPYPLVSVIVPTWNSEEDIEDFLNSLERQTYPKASMELVVVDNGSTDNSVQVIQRWHEGQRMAGWFGLHLIESPRNNGIAQAYNLGYANSSSRAFAILRGEADVILEPEVVESLCGVIRDNPSVGVAGARGLLYGTVPPQLDHAASYMNWWNGRLRRVDPDHLVDCDSVLGPTFLTRRSCIDEMQFFFPSDRFLASELEFCTRVKRGGRRVVCEPRAVAYHKGARSSGNLDFGRFGYVAQRETVLFHLKYNPLPQKLFCLAWNAAYSLKQAFKGNRFQLLGLRDGFRWWGSHHPTLPPKSTKDTSLAEWLLKS
jgi:Predicted glycosyltransferases